MDFELLPTVSLLPETNSLLIAPVELLAGALNSYLNCSATRSSSSAATTPASSIG
ncbi:MAG: hypothetical protein WCW68_00980 [Methanothrix sp.]